MQCVSPLYCVYLNSVIIILILEIIMFSLFQRNSQVSPSPSGEQQTSTSPSGEQQGSASPSGEQQGSVSPTEEETKSSDGKEGSNGEKTSDGNTSPSQDKGGSVSNISLAD